MATVTFDIDIIDPDDDEDTEELVADEVRRLVDYILERAVENSGGAEIHEAVVILGNAIETARAMMGEQATGRLN